MHFSLMSTNETMAFRFRRAINIGICKRYPCSRKFIMICLSTENIRNKVFAQINDGIKWSEGGFIKRNSVVRTKLYDAMWFSASNVRKDGVFPDFWLEVVQKLLYVIKSEEVEIQTRCLDIFHMNFGTLFEIHTSGK